MIADPYLLRREFPVFEHHPGLVYLDNAATTQKPRAVLDAERNFYERQNANAHRGIYPLAADATASYERVREKVRFFLNARHSREVIFTSGTTASINLVAQSFALPLLEPGDAVVVSALEHHANLIPWQQACLQRGARLLVVPVDRAGVPGWQVLPGFFRENRVRLLALTHVSNSLGTINPLPELIALAHQHGVPVLVDAAQSAASLPLDVQALDVDFLAFSAHKLFGPTGVGVLYGKTELLEAMPPWQFGGGMIRDVTFEQTRFAPIPQRFEAGTPNLAGVAGFGAALDFLNGLDRDALYRHTRSLLARAAEALSRIPGLTLVGTAPEKTAILSFVLDGIHPHDIATILGDRQLCIRAGHHCTQPLMDSLGLPGTARASFAFYNTEADVEALEEGVKAVVRVLGRPTPRM